MLDRRSRRRRASVAAAVAALGLSACGGDDFENERRPPVPISVTGVITAQEVTISPDAFGAGPIVVTISNQTPQSHRVTLEGTSDDGTEISESTGPINPQDTATIQQSLPPGDYEVTANSDGRAGAGIRPGEISVGDERPSGSDDLELP